MKIPRIESAFDECEGHLVKTQSYGTEIEAILTSYVSLVICAEFESRARSIVAKRAAGDGSDSYLGNFGRIASLRLMRSLKIGDLAGAAGWFHSNCKERFHQSLDDRAKDAWDTIMLNRHGVAHNTSDVANMQIVSNLTFRDLQDLYPRAVTVLDALDSAIS